MKQYELKAGLFDRTRTLAIEPDVIRYDEFDLKSRGYNEMSKSEIADFKYIAEPIRWDFITVGRKYTITLKNTRGQADNNSIQEFLLAEKSLQQNLYGSDNATLGVLL